MSKPFTYRDLSVSPGGHGFTRVPVTNTLMGTDLTIPVHVFHGTAPGPVLLLTNLIHGKEYPPLRVFYELKKRLDLQGLAGTVVMVPVANPVAFFQNSRITLEMDIDFGNLNRVFPGRRATALFGGGPSHPSDRTLTEMIASLLVEEIFPIATHCLDFHCHHDGNIVLKMLHSGTDETREDSYRLSRAFGLGLIHEEPKVFSGTGKASLAKLGVPAVAVEVGGAEMGGALERLFVDIQVKGVINVMKDLGMLDGAPELPARQAFFQNAPKVRPSRAGYLVVEFEPEDLMRDGKVGVDVKEGTVLGRVFDAYTLEEVEVLTAPVDGILYMTRRSGPVHAGWHAFGLVEAANIQWVE
jgi:predicted deacylase